MNTIIQVLNRNKVENPYCSLSLLQQTMMISSVDHQNLSAVCQAQAYQIVGSQKSGPLEPVGGGGGGCDIDIAPVITLVHVLVLIFIYFFQSNSIHTVKTKIEG